MTRKKITAAQRQRLFSGIKPSGRLHLGNYLGAVKNWVSLQEKYDCVFGVVDYHAITVPQKPSELTQHTRDMVLDLLALGLDPARSILMVQSHVPQHAELAWIFNTLTPVSWLDRLPPYREQIAEHPERNQMGVLDYPVLMAADILIYRSAIVPVGEDQMAHIDITNEIAKRFNHLFGHTLDPVKPLLTEGARIMSLQEPKKKMTKSGGDTISLADTPVEMREKIKKAVTDSGSDIRYTPGAKPAISNLLTIYKELSGKNYKDLEALYAGKGYAEFKKGLTEVIVDYFAGFRARRATLEKKPGYVAEVLHDGAKRAILISQHTLDAVKNKMGFFGG